jgi:hypothetical protein
LTEEDIAAELRLPEDYNGLGYQNLISMVFRLMSFRDGWMKVGKAGKRAATTRMSRHALLFAGRPFEN